MKTMFALLTVVLVSLVVPAEAQVEPFGEFRDKPALCTKDDARKVMSGVVNLRRDLPPEEQYADAQGNRIVATSGSAWRVSERLVATVSHVAEGMRLTEDWNNITILQSGVEYEEPQMLLSTRARVRFVGVNNSGEAAALVELEDALPDSVMLLKARFRHLHADEPVMAIGYSSRKLRFATGRLAYPKESSEGKPGEEESTLLPFELADEETNDRLAIGHGASGGPILDCRGNVVALVAKNRTRDIAKDEALKNIIETLRRIGGTGIEVPSNISSAWGQYNAFGVPVSDLSPPAR